MFWQSILPAGLLAATGAGASLLSEPMGVEGQLLGRDWSELERRTEQFFGEDESGTGQPPRIAHIITVRQATPNSNVVTNADGTLNMAAWDEAVTKSCMAELGKVPVSTNPSGTCVCYNLPALNNQTGAFAADLRLFQKSPPREAFTGIPQQNIQVGLRYEGASVSPISASAASKMVVVQQKRQAADTTGTGTTTIATDGSGLRLLQTYMFVGQIDQTRMNPSMNMAQIEALVIPTVTLSAINSAGQTVSTNVTANEAAFLQGAFSDSIVMSDFAVANLAVDRSLAGLGNGTVPFVLPGVALMVYPIGLVITGTWTVALCGTIAYGTFMRMGFREQYRRRIARVGGKASLARF